MNFTTGSTRIEKLKSDCIVIGVYNNGELSKNAQQFEQNSAFSIQALFANKELSGKAGQVLTIYQTNEAIKKVLIVGFGDKGSVTPSVYRSSMASCAATLSNSPSKKIDLWLDDIAVDGWTSYDKALCCAEKISDAYYQFTRCKSDLQKKTKPNIYYHCTNIKLANTGLTVGTAIGKGINIAKELGNLPANICTPTYLASEARKLARAHKSITTKVLSEKQMAELGMHSLLSVSAGSKQAAQFIIMEYKGAAKTQKPHILVGKGITFDSGGISLKPGAGMDEMKYDMCGAAGVFGTINTLALLAPKINVVAIVAAAENMPSGEATKPGDVVTAMSGKTIEILNTDAEGRLVLCDALTYAERYKPQSVIDIATLTGACVIALGAHATGLFSNNDELAHALLDSGEQSGDRAWHMPLWDDYKTQLNSPFADLANIGGREAGSITAACFLSHFTESYPWAHLDIAGTAWKSGKDKGATGRPVPLLTHYLLSKVEK